MVHILTTSSNQIFIGKLDVKLSSEDSVYLRDVYLVNSSIRDDKKLTFSKPKFIKNRLTRFHNFLYLAEAEENIENLYLSLFEESEDYGNK